MKNNQKIPTVSVIIPTHNRPEMVKNAINSVLIQTYQDFEVIIVDVGLEKRADIIAGGFNDPRISYIRSEKELNGSAARNIGIKQAKGRFIAFLDDDDEWVPEKLAIQMKEFENTLPDVGFSFSAVKNIRDNGSFVTQVPEEANDYFELALGWFSGFLTVTLIIKKDVFDDVGLFDESFPSHQESDLMIRISKKYKGLGINRPLTIVNMKGGYERVGGDFARKIQGHEMIIKKHFEEFKKRPKILAFHYFELGLFSRDNGQYNEARSCFKKAIGNNPSFRYLIHYLSMFFGGRIYKLIRK